VALDADRRRRLSRRRCAGDLVLKALKAPQRPAMHPDFRRVLGAELASNFGSMLSRLAIPWLATLLLDASAWQMSALLVADVAAGAVGALALGAWVERRPKRAVMLAADGLRALLLALLALAAWQGWLTMPLLVAAAAMSGLLTMAFELARSAWLARRFAPQSLAGLNATLGAGSSLAETAAFAIGGWLYQGLGAVLALAVDALSYAVSALCLRGVREVPPIAGATTQASAGPASFPALRVLRGDIAAGLAAVRASPLLRRLAVIDAFVALAFAVAGTSIMIFVARDLGLPTGLQGVIFAMGGLGSLAGAAAAVALGRQLGAARAMALGLTLLVAGNLCLPLAPDASWLGVALLLAHQVVGDGGHALQQVHDRTLRQTAVAPALLARVDSALRALGQTCTLAGAVLGGAAASAMGARAALWLAVLLLAAAALVAARLRLPHGE
jgi:Na+/melibiose symporter-like transporter